MCSCHTDHVRHYGIWSSLAVQRPCMVLKIHVSVQIFILLIFYSSQFILFKFYSCKHLQSTRVCCDFCDCIFSQECDSVTSSLFQIFSLSISLPVSYFNRLWAPAFFALEKLLPCPDTRN